MEHIRVNRIGLAAVLVGIAFAAFSASQASASCCFLDGTCADISQTQCQAGGGVYFDGVTCAFHPCPSMGACCLPNGSCSIRGEVGCQNQGGIWYEGLDCSACGADVSACCLPDGSCEDLTAAQCTAAGGEFHAAQTCAFHPCRPPEGGACPRSPGFWKQQCRCSDGEGGPVKFSCSEFDQITACIDAKSSFLSWGGGHGSFCSLIDPSGSTNPRKEAQRQFVALLANVCAGELDIIANGGDVVSLPESTPIDCGDLDATTIGELIDEIDDRLVDLEGDDLGLPSVRDQYESITTCLNSINSGIGFNCTENDDDDGDHDDDDDDDDDDDSDKAGQSSAPNSVDFRSWGAVKGIYR